MTVAAAGAGASFLSQLALARSMSTSDYGAYLYLLAMMNVLLIAGRLELDGSAVRWMSQYTATDRWGLARGYVVASYRTVLLASAAVSAIGACLLAYGPGVAVARLGASGFIACLLLPVTGSSLLTTGILRGLKEYVLSQVPFDLLRPLLMILGIGVLTVNSATPLTTAGALWLNLAVGLVVLGLLLSLLYRRAPAELRAAAPRYDWRAWFSAAGAFLVMSLAQLILSNQMDLLVVGSMLSTADAAKYGSAGQLSAIVSLGITGVLFVGAPRIGELFAQGAQPALRQHLRSVSRACLLAGVPLFLAVLILGRWLLGLYGPQFVEAFPILVVLGAAQLTSALVGAHAGAVVSMTRLERGGAVIVCVCAALNMALAIWLTADYGVLGTASATLVATILRSIALDMLLRRRLGVTVLPH
jgi:O-antigen/teichoic acid export membrane protein